MRAANSLEGRRRFGLVFVVLTLALAASAPLAAQMHGPPTWTSVGGHPLAPSPTVMSVGGPHLPPPLPSVTSIPNYGYRSFGYAPGYAPYFNGAHRGRRGYGYAGYSYSVPYYIPVDGYGYGYDYVGGPPLYSGPPMSNDSTLHIIVEQPPAKAYSREPDDAEAYTEPPRHVRQEPAAPPRDAKPGEPTVLVFRDGHQQEVTNYAIMGQTVYIFDKRTQKIALADLDVPATVQANDDRGMSFSIPAQKAVPKKAVDLEPKSAPDPKAQPAPNVAFIAP